MLQELQVRDYALVEEVDIEFGEGLNVISGETGAGKSIIVGAIMLLLGGRAGSEHIRTGSDEASVTGVFALREASAVRETLEELGLDWPDDGVLVVSRRISRSGRSQCRVNGRPATHAMLQEIGERLVDVCGQHEHQSLLQASRHVDFLDSFAGAEALRLRDAARACYARLAELRARLAALRSGVRERAQRLDMLRFQAAEIDAAHLAPGEDAELARERTVLAAAEQLLTHASAAYADVFGSEDGSPGAADKLARALSELGAIAKIDDSLSGISGLLEGALAACEEAARSIRVYRDAIDLDPSRLAEVEARIAAIQRLKRKYGDSVDDVLELRRRIEEEIRTLAGSDDDIAACESELEEARGRLGEICASLRDVREQAARTLEELVAAELAELAMASAAFRVSLLSKEDPEGVPVRGKLLAAGPLGSDSVEFLLSANPGEPPKPLAKVASGGEISRVMLALKSILASVDRVDTLVFDEIDVGIGGKTASKVGEKLARTSRSRQVVCVTHLPQIARMASVHHSIAKESDGGRARVVVTRLSGEERVREIARMLGGASLTATTLEHAREMLDLAGAPHGEED